MAAPDELSAAGRLGRLALLFLAHAIGTANITLVLVMAPAVEEALQIGHAGFGLVVSSYYAGVLVLSLPAGEMVDRLGIRATLISAHVLLAAGMAVLSRSQGIVGATIGLALCGSGYAMVNPATARGVLMWFPLRGRATAMGVKQTGVPAGGVIVALLAAAGHAEWRELAQAVALATLASGAGYLLLRAGHRPASALARRGAIRTVLRLRNLALFNAAACLFAAAQTAFFAYLVLYARDALSAPTAVASLSLAAAHTASAVGRVGWGAASDLMPSNGRIAALVACGLIAVAGVLLLLQMPMLGAVALLGVPAALLGATVGGYAGLLQTAAAEAVDPQRAGASIGYNMVATSAGTMLGPVAFGAGVVWLGYGPGWTILAAVLALGTGLFYASGRVSKGGGAQ